MSDNDKCHILIGGWSIGLLDMFRTKSYLYIIILKMFFFFNEVLNLSLYIYKLGGGDLKVFIGLHN